MSGKVTTFVFKSDTGPFQAGLKEADAKWRDTLKGFASGAGTLGEVAAAAGPVGAAFAAMAGGASIAGVAVARFLVDAAKQATELGSRLQDMSTTTGTSAESLQRLAANGKASFEQIQNAITKANKQLATAPEQFTALGLSVDKLRKADGEGLLLAISDRLKELPPGFQQIAASQALMGKSGAENLPMLTSNLREAGEEAMRTGRIISNEDVAALDELGDAVKIADKSWDGLVDQLGAAIATSPELLKLVVDVTHSLGDMAHWVQTNRDFISELTTRTIAAGKALAEYSGIAAAARGFKPTMGLIETGASLLGMDMGGSGGGSVTASARVLGPAYDPGLAARIKKDAEERAAAAKREAELWREAGLGLHDYLEQMDRSGLGQRLFGGQTKEDKEAFSPGAQGAAAQQMDPRMMPGYIAQQGALTQAERDEKKGVSDAAGASEAAMAKAKLQTTDWTGAVLQLDSAFRLMGANAGTALGALALGLTGGLAALIQYKNTANALAKAQSANALAIQNGDKTGAASSAQDIHDIKQQQTQQKVMGGINAAGTAVSIWQNNQYQRSAGAGALSGASSGAAAGAAFGPYGMVVGAVVGGIIGALSGGAFRDACKKAGQVLGGEVSDELGKAIMKTAKDDHISTANASLLHISDFMSESGKSPVEEGKQIKDLFAGIASGAIPAKEGMEELNKDFDAMATAAANGDQAAQKLTGDLIQQGIATGKLTDSMQSFIKDAMAGMATGADEMMQGLADIGKDVPLGEFGSSAAELFVAGFTAEIAQKGILQAIEDDGKGIEDFYQRLSDEGAQYSAGMLAPWMQLSAAINNDADPSLRGFLEMLKGMGDVFAGIDKMGFATQGSFQALEGGVRGANNALNEAGVVGPAAFQAMAPQLAQIIAAHNKYGFVIDEGTQKLIDQAKAAGVAFPTDPVDAMVSAVKELVDTIREMNGLPPRDWGPPPPDYITNPPGGGGGGDDGARIPGSPDPIPAASGFGPMIVPNMGGGLGPLIQTHAGEGVLVVPKSRVSARGFFHAADGYGTTTVDLSNVARRANAAVSSRSADGWSGSAGAASNTIHIDARGSTNPKDTIEQIRVAITDGVLKAPIQELARRQASRK